MKILHIEDNPLDAELVQAALQPQWPHCHIDRVDGAGPAVAAMTKGGYDIILSDFSMPNFDGLEALKLARVHCPATPFIFLSGTLGDERATSALQAGAEDFISKDRPQRLVSAVKRSLRDVANRRDRQDAEEKLLHLQRLENIGMLTAGIAHDFNNVLATVMMGLPLLRDHIADPGLKKVAASMERSIERGTGLIRQLLGFAHSSTGGAQVIDPHQIVRELANVIRQTFPETLTIRDALPDTLPPIRANATEVHQVLLNLCVNARDAMPQDGTLTISARSERIDAVAAAALPGGRAGHFVAIEIADTGTGIAPDVIERIWEPFFTTKGLGRGTGLGLATVKRILGKYEGFVRLRSEIGRGTSISVYFPATDQVLEPVAPRAAPHAEAGHGELLILADDDTPVREAMMAALSDRGYRVLGAVDGTAALALLAEHPEVRLLVADIRMPNLNGIQLTLVVKSLNPDLPVLMISGLAEEESHLHSRQWDGAFLAKPFSAERLAACVGSLLYPAGYQQERGCEQGSLF